MNRKDEYFELLNELDDSPVELEYTLIRAESKLRSKRRNHFLIFPISSIASFLILFTIFVNCSITFAYACGKIPFIKDFAQFVASSPSLSAAVENEYVQPIEMEQTKNKIAARVEYVIVDQKQLAIFYTLDSSIYSNIDVTPEIRDINGNNFEGYSISSDSFDSKNGELRQLTVDFMETNMPSSMQLILKIRDYGSINEEEPLEESEFLDEKEDSKYDSISELDLSEPVAEFNFELKFDPFFTAQGKIISLNQNFELDDQRLTVTTMELYPTHIRLNFADDKNNTAWLKALEFYLVNEKGRRFEAISNGITATGSIDSPMMQSHRLESPFFSKSKNLTLYITGVTWLDKDMEKIRINLKEKTAESLPQNIIFEHAERQRNDWIVGFSSKRIEENHSYQLFLTNYYDEEGTEYSYHSWSSATGYFDEIKETYIENPDRFYSEFSLQDYPFDVVYLSPVYSRMVQLDKAIKIKINLNEK